jgi:hypothetical protein
VVLDARTAAADTRSGAELGAMRAALVKLVGADHGDKHADWRKALGAGAGACPPAPAGPAAPATDVTPPAAPYDATKPTQPIK